MSDSDFPRKSNLGFRKQRVLQIAADNFKMVKRLARVQSSVGRDSIVSPSSVKSGGYRSRPRSSIVAMSYPNQFDPMKSN